MGIAEAKLITERPGSHPNPNVEVEQTLADGSTIRVVWSWLPINEVAKLVTVYDIDG